MRCLKPSAVGQQVVQHLLGHQRLAVVDLDQHLVLEFQCRFDLLGQLPLVEHVGDADPDARDLVLVARADAAAGGADLLAARVPLDHLVDGDVIRHQQMRVGRDQQPLGVDAAIFQTLQLVEQYAGIDHHAVADHVGDAWRQDPRWNEVQREILAGRQDDGMPGIVPALIPHDPLHAATEQVGGLTLALVAPLGADEHDCRHGIVSRSSVTLCPAGEPLYPTWSLRDPQGAALITTDVVVLLFGGRRLPRPLAGLAAEQVDGPDDIDAVVGRARRLIVVGSDADLAAVLTRLLRADRLDVEVGHATGWRTARRARRGTARRVPLIRDETGHVIVGARPNGAVRTVHRCAARRSSTTRSCSTARSPACGSNRPWPCPACGRPSPARADGAGSPGGPLSSAPRARW